MLPFLMTTPKTMIATWVRQQVTCGFRSWSSGFGRSCWCWRTTCLAPTCWSASWCAWGAFPALPWTKIVPSSSCLKSSKCHHAPPAWWAFILTFLHCNGNQLPGIIVDDFLDFSDKLRHSDSIRSSVMGSLFSLCSQILNLPASFWPFLPSFCWHWGSLKSCLSFWYRFQGELHAFYTNWDGGQIYPIILQKRMQTRLLFSSKKRPTMKVKKIHVKLAVENCNTIHIL